jgi:lipid II:glycine glycyltransferase (peptidoglycan interpeptide bridge formation enzyme)
MESTKVNFKREIDALITIRDELKVKAHLAKADIKDEINRLETKWQRVEEELKRGASHMNESLGENTKELVKELRERYDMLKRRIES